MTVIGYLRVSTPKQSNEHWRLLLSDYAQQRGLAAPQWVEETISGARTWRERKLAKVLATAAPGDVLLVGEASRIGRNTEDALNFVRHAMKAGVTVHVVEIGEVFTPDEENANARLMLGLKFLLAEHERNLLRYRIKLGLTRARENGTKLGGYRGTAYQGTRSGQHHPDKERILRAVRAGGSINGIAAQFGVSRTSVYRWLQESHSGRAESAS